MVKEVILCTTSHHAIVVDHNDNQWYFEHAKQEGESVMDYLTDVFLKFLTCREQCFNCDEA